MFRKSSHKIDKFCSLARGSERGEFYKQEVGVQGGGCKYAKRNGKTTFHKKEYTFSVFLFSCFAFNQANLVVILTRAHLSIPLCVGFSNNQFSDAKNRPCMETQTCSSHMQNKNKTCTLYVQSAVREKKVKRPHFVQLMPLFLLRLRTLQGESQKPIGQSQFHHKNLRQEKFEYFFVSSGRLN